MEKNNFAKLSAKDILEHNFQVEFKGYKVEEVDMFLDKILEDYNFFEAELQKKDREIKNAKADNLTLQNDLKDLGDRLNDSIRRLKDLGEKGTENEYLIKRITSLEKKVANKK